MKISNKSWHFRIAKIGAGHDYDYMSETDICHYTRCFLLGLIFTILGFFVSVAMVASLGDTLAWCAAMIVSQTLLECNVLALPSLMIVSAVVTLVLMWYISISYTAWRYNGEQTIVSKMYDAWKNKYCVKIIVE